MAPPMRKAVRQWRSGRALLRRNGLTERLKQRAIDRIALRIEFGMPLHAERKARRIGHADRLDGAVVGHALDDDALAWVEDALPVQRVHTDAVTAEDPGERTAGREPHVVAGAEHHLIVRMRLARFEA